MWDHKAIEENGEPTGIVGLHAVKVPFNGPKVDSRDVEKALLDDRNVGIFAVSLEMNEIGASKWKKMTTENLDRQIAIVMDDAVFCAPVVNGVMDKNSSITGNFTLEEAKDLVALINGGGTIWPVNIVRIENL
jgi:SecD/SecF fusion protein